MPEIAVMISIRPEWCMLISQGKKTVEVRKTRPKLETPFKCYIYESKGNERVGNENFNVYLKGSGRQAVIGEFVCDAVFEINKPYGMYNRGTCLLPVDLFRYAQANQLYGWHISDLVIYDEPKYIGDFKVEVNTKQWCFTKKLERPPQSWCYVMEG